MLDYFYLTAPALLCLYYFIVWLAVGLPRNPGTAVVRYEPPQEMSAAEARYLFTTGSDGRTLAAVIAALAVRGCLRVERQGGVYKLTRLAPNPAVEESLALEERHALQFLFEDGPAAEIRVAATQKDNLRGSRYVADIQRDLAKRLDGLYFTRNLGYVALGVLGTFAAAFALALTARGFAIPGALFMTFWTLFCGLVLGVLIEASFLPMCRAAVQGSARWVTILPGLAALAVFGAVMVYLSGQLARNVSPAYVAMVWGLMLVNLVWGPLLKRMTPEGRQMLDQLLGFRQFLLKAEQDRLQRLNTPNETPSAQFTYLPFAIALEVREAWGDHLSGAFFAATVQR